MVFLPTKEVVLLNVVSFVQDLLNETDEEMFEKTYNRVVKYEDISDNMEIEIAKYLEKVSEAQLIEETTSKIHDLMREISELESIGDSCYNIARIFKRVRDNQEKFIDSQKANINKIMNLTLSSLEQMMVVLNGRREDLSMKDTYRIENEINTLRDEYKMENMSEIKNHKYDYFIGTAYIDLVNECERLGDYVVNVVEAKFSKF